MRNNETIARRLKLLRLNHDLKLAEVADHLGISKQAYNYYELMQTKSIPDWLIDSIAELYGIEPEVIIGWSAYPELDSVDTRTIPLIGDVACGEPIVANQEYGYSVAVGDQSDVDFCLRCKGDSMTGIGIHDGDIVFLREQNFVVDGDIAAVYIDDEVTLKRVFFHDDFIELRPENTAYKSIIVPRNNSENFGIIGKAIFYQSPIR